MLYEVFLQVRRSGRTHAHVPGLPGCNWLADSPEDSWRRAPAALNNHLAWLRQYGQPAPLPTEPVIPHLAQQHKSTAREGNLIGFFESDRQPVYAAEIPGLLALMTCARADLLALTQGLPGDILVREPAPGAWSIEQVLRHVAGAERWYLTRILDPASLPQFKPSRSVWQRLAAVRALALERLASLSEEARCTIVSDKSGELWSARKVFRRFLEHEREHTAHIQQILDQS